MYIERKKDRETENRKVSGCLGLAVGMRTDCKQAQGIVLEYSAKTELW